MSSPDLVSRGFLSSSPDALRYDYVSLDPYDVAMRVVSLISTTDRILDVGCGTGSLAAVIQDRTGASVTGIEPDPERSSLARKKGLDVFPGYLTTSFLQEHGPFDAIIFADVLEHLASPGDMIELAKNGLSPDGVIIASVPNVAHWFVRTDILRGRFRYRECGIMDATHLRWFTQESLATFFANLGFTIERHLYTANFEMPEYRERFPWRHVPRRARRRIIEILLKTYPGLFGCQHVVRARPLPAVVRGPLVMES